MRTDGGGIMLEPKPMSAGAGMAGSELDKDMRPADPWAWVKL